jgi:hypothetical protein
MQPRPITYRAEIIGPLLTSIAAGECCSVVGISGVGKSNMVQHMLRPDVLRHHLGDQADTLRFVILDANMLADWSAWGMFEGLIEALLSTLGSELVEEGVASLRAAHTQVLATPGQPALAFRHCAEALALLCARWRVVLLFDEFDPLFAQLPGAVLHNLRGLRDRHKYRLMYLTFSRQPLASLRDDGDWNAIEPFVELLTLRELGLQPLHDEDARLEVQRFTARHDRAIGAMAQSLIVELSGGHPALLRALIQEALHDEARIVAERQHLHRSPAIRLECAKIWQQLTGDEQDELLAAARRRKGDRYHSQSMLLKGLLSPRPKGSPAVFSPLFAAYLAELGTPLPQGAPAPLTIDPQARQVIYYGQDIAGQLGEKERALLLYLWEHYGAICPISEVAKAVYPGEQRVYDQQYGEEFDRLRTLAGRLRRKLVALAPDQPELFAIYRRLGYRLGIPADI